MGPTLCIHAAFDVASSVHWYSSLRTLHRPTLLRVLRTTVFCRATLMDAPSPRMALAPCYEAHVPGTCASTSGILRLDYKGIQLLLAGVFDGLTALTRLRLDKNALASLTVGVFDWLWAVTTLYLDYNALTNLPVGVFDGLSALTMLSLDCNLFASLSAGVLSGLTAVTTLHLYDNALTNLLVGGLTAVILFIQDLYSW